MLGRGDGPPITPEQMGISTPATATGQTPKSGDVVVRGEATAIHDATATRADATSRDDAVAHEQPSIEKLKAELFDREVPEEYQKILQDLEHGSPFFPAGDAYAMHFDVLAEDLKHFLEARIRGKTFFDLGCGRYTNIGEGIALQSYNAERYVGIDLNLRKEQAKKNRFTQKDAYGIREDVLRFVSRLKSETGGVYFLSGLETWSNGKSEIAYKDALTHEMARTLGEGDIVILAFGTDDFLKHTGRAEKFGLRKVSFPQAQKEWGDLPGNATIRVYEKVGESAEK